MFGIGYASSFSAYQLKDQVPVAAAEVDHSDLQLILVVPPHPLDHAVGAAFAEPHMALIAKVGKVGDLALVVTVPTVLDTGTVVGLKLN